MTFSIDHINSAPHIETRKALILIDFQNDFVDQVEGKLPVGNVPSFVRQLPALAARFRTKGPVIFVQTEYLEARSAMAPEVGSYNILLREHSPREPLSTQTGRKHHRGRSSITSKSIDTEAFLQASIEETARPCGRGTVGARLCPFTADAFNSKRDISIVKSQYSAFKDTNLLIQLRTRMIQHLYVAGSLSNISVYATVIDAVRHGIEVTLIEDCLGYRNLQCHHEAVKQMVDTMGANGIDYQELMDDLAGLLGDVIREEDFSTRFHVTVNQSTAREDSPSPMSSSHQSVEEWATRHDIHRKRNSRNAMGGVALSETPEPDADYDSPSIAQASTLHLPEPAPETTFPKKRTTTLADTIDGQPPPKVVQQPLIRRTPSESARSKLSRPRIRGPRSSANRPITPSSARALSSPVSSSEATSLSSLTSNQYIDIPSSSSPSSPNSGESAHTEKSSSSHLDRVQIDAELIAEAVRPAMQRKAKSKKLMSVVGPAESIGEGDSSVTGNILPYGEADAAFYALKNTIQWQKMFHRTGEVPRLVAVQGLIDETTGFEPIYRHPADESPEMLQFDDMVDTLRAAAEKHVGHGLNHVLIQYYRNGEDNISEHSDKTLDIVRGSSIVNLSLGAQRVMTLRTKKDPAAQPVHISQLEEPERRVQKVPLMHNSLFVLGSSTNQYWLHSVRADKRPTSEKTAEELAYGGERISLTFRQIGTFFHRQDGRIWGQGARAKTSEVAKVLLKGEDAEKEGEGMIRAFGQENHSSATWDWDSWYGKGFDVVNFETKTVA